MRNLEILTKSIDTLKNLNEGEQITNSCIDEFAKLLIVYTTHHRLVLFTFQDILTARTTFKISIALVDENPNLENSQLIQLEYI